MKKAIFIFIFSFVFLLFGCSFIADSDSGNNPSNTSKPATITKEYWGVWIQMDTGNEFYIDGNSIYKTSSSNKKYSKIQDGISGYSLENTYILKKGNIRYFKKGGVSRDFSIQIAGFSDSYSRAARAASTGQQGITGRRENGNNPSDTETTTSEADGKTEFTDAVADDPQIITIDDGTSVEVTPEYDGQDMGTIPIVEKGMYGFKTIYSIDSDEQGFCYGNMYKTYSLVLNLKNIGYITCATSVYEISCEDPNFEFVSGPKNGNFSSIESGSAKNVELKVRYGKLDVEYVDVPIKIKITDSKYTRTWNDSITLRFYKGLVSFKVNSRNFDANSKATLNGFFIYPDGRSKRFTVSAGNTRTVMIPWSTKDYILAFSGATATNEMGYSFAFSDRTQLASLNGTWSIDEITGYENNDIVDTAFRVIDLNKPVKAYLGDSDIDYFIINNSTEQVSFNALSYSAHAISDAIGYSSLNNGDKTINPGETIAIDIRIHNDADNMIYGINCELSTISSYVTITNPNKDYGNLNKSYYKALYGYAQYATSDNGKYANGDYLQKIISMSYNDDFYYTGVLGASYGWRFSVAENTPIGTTIPFKLTFTEENGCKWFDTFELTIEKPDVRMYYSTNEISDSKNYSDSNNGDKKINPGETIWMDVRVQNNGYGRAFGIKCKLHTDSEFVLIDTPERNLYDFDGLKYKTLYGAEYYKEDNDYKYGDNEVWNIQNYCYYYYGSGILKPTGGWKLVISEAATSNTKIPMTLDFEDYFGNTWTSTFNLDIN